jgi:PII-like signaling protein
MSSRSEPGKLVRIHCTEADHWEGEKMYVAILTKCQEMNISGATVYRGLEGFGASAIIHHAHKIAFHPHAPIMISIIDSPDKIASLVPELDRMVEKGLVAISDVEIVRFERGSEQKAEE